MKRIFAALFRIKSVFAAVYLLVLATQLPHVWYAYAHLERADIPVAAWTAIGAAVAFELSTGVFTYRVVTGSRSKWTRWGLAFFILASVVANGYYYGWWEKLFAWLMPVFATVALPLALALFAEEFAAETERDERAARREQRRLEREQAGIEPAANKQGQWRMEWDPIEPAQSESEPAGPSFRCAVCGREFASQQGVNAHMRRHRE